MDTCLIISNFFWSSKLNLEVKVLLICVQQKHEVKVLLIDISKQISFYKHAFVLDKWYQIS